MILCFDVLNLEIMAISNCSTQCKHGSPREMWVFFNKFILHPNHSFFSFILSQSLLLPSPYPLSTHSSAYVQKGASHGQIVVYKVAVRLRTSPWIKVGQGNSV